MAFCSEHLKWDQNTKFTALKETTNIFAPFMWEPPGGAKGGQEGGSKSGEGTA